MTTDETASSMPDHPPLKSSKERSEGKFAQRLREFGPVGLLAFAIVLAGNLLFVPVSALLVLWWRHLSRTSWPAIGYKRPRNWFIAVGAGVVFGAAGKLLMKSLVMPLLGAPAVNHAYHYLVGNRAAIPMTLYLVTIGAGFGEETVFRGFLFERFGKLFGASVIAKTAIVIITSIWFGLAHYFSQGLPGVEQATIVGLAFGTVFAISGQIFMLMIAHAAFDLTAYAIIYWDLEQRVAHFFFK